MEWYGVSVLPGYRNPSRVILNMLLKLLFFITFGFWETRRSRWEGKYVLYIYEGTGFLCAQLEKEIWMKWLILLESGWSHVNTLTIWRKNISFIPELSNTMDWFIQTIWIWIPCKGTKVESNIDDTQTQSRKVQWSSGFSIQQNVQRKKEKSKNNSGYIWPVAMY